MNIFELGKRVIRESRTLHVASNIFNMVCFNSIKVCKGNIIDNRGAFLKNTKIRIKGSGNRIVLGERCYLNKCQIQVYGNNNRIEIESMNAIHEGSLYIEDNGGTIYIGERSLVCGPCQFAVIEGKTIKIGKRCLFSSETVIRTGDSHSVMDINGNRINDSKNVEICDHVWVGYRGMILKGSKIGANSIVSTGAIVTRKFNESNVVLAGVPAKIVEKEVDWCLERI